MSSSSCSCDNCKRKSDIADVGEVVELIKIR